MQLGSNISLMQYTYGMQQTFDTDMFVLLCLLIVSEIRKLTLSMGSEINQELQQSVK